MKIQVCKLCQTAIAVCCFVVAGCRQAVPTVEDAGYEVMTVKPYR